MLYEKGMKLRTVVTLIDDVTYGVEPRYYYDDGIRHIYKFIDEEGNLLVWKTSKVIGIEYINENNNEAFKFIDLGDKIFIRGNVKGHDNFRGEDQVVITRVSVDYIVEQGSMTEEQVTKFKQELQLSKLPKDIEIRTISYREYKGSYNSYETLVDSFKRTDHGCFIDIIIPNTDVSNIYYYSE